MLYMEATYEVTREIGKLNDSKRTPELNLVKWNNNEEKYDIRRWAMMGRHTKGLLLKRETLIDS